MPSPRLYPQRRLAPDYPAAMEVRRIASNGSVSWKGRFIFVSEALAGEHLGFEEVDDTVRNIVYYRTLLGRLDAHSGKVTRAEPV